MIHPYSVTLLSTGSGHFQAKSFFPVNTPTFLKHSHSTPIRLRRWNRRSVPKRRHIKFRPRGITQKKAHSRSEIISECLTYATGWRVMMFTCDRKKNKDGGHWWPSAALYWWPNPPFSVLPVCQSNSGGSRLPPAFDVSLPQVKIMWYRFWFCFFKIAVFYVPLTSICLHISYKTNFCSLGTSEAVKAIYYFNP